MRKGFLFFIYLCAYVLNAQSIAYKHFSLEGGLGNPLVYNTCEDKYNRVWAATNDGLYYFSGLNFRKYELPEQIKSANIHSVGASNDGSLYFFIKQKGLYKLSNEKVELLLPDTFDFELGAAVEMHGDKCLLYGVGSDPTVFDIKSKKVFFDLPKAKPDNSNVKSNIGDSNTIISYRENTINFIANDLSSKTKFSFPFKILAVDVKPNNILHIATKNKLYKFKNYKIIDSVLVEEKEAFNPNIIYFDSKGRYWISYNGRTKNRILLPNKNAVDLNDILGLENLLILNFMEDSKGNIWVSTVADGIFLFHNNNFFKELKYDGIKLPMITSLRKSSNNNIFICTPLGLYEYRAEKIVKRKTKPIENQFFVNDIVRLNEEKHVAVCFGSKLPSGELGDGLGNDSIVSILGLTISNVVDNSFYVGAHKPAMIKVNKNLTSIKTEGEVINLPNKHSRYVTSMFLESNGKLWLGAVDGLFEFENGKFSKQNGEKLNSQVGTIVEKNKALYFGMTSGLNIYKDKAWYFISKVGQTSISNVKSIAFDRENNIWLATKQGLFCFKKNDTLFFNSLDGLPPSRISSLYFDSLGNKLLIGSSIGLSELSLSNKLVYEHLADSINIDAISIENKERLNLYDSFQNIELNPNELNISIRLISKNLVHNSDYKYFYKLNDEVWHSLEANIFELKNLNRGEHTVTFRGTYDMIHYSNLISLKINAKPHFWQTKLFWILCILCILLISLFIVVRIFRKTKLEARQKIALLNQMNELKYASLMSSINPHFIFNAMNSIQSYINNDKLLMANDYLVRFSRLIRLILDKASDKAISIADEVIRLEYYLGLEKTRIGDKLNYKIIIDPSIKTNEVLIPNMVIQPFVENAIIHGINKSYEKGIIEIRFCLENEHIKIEVDDNGLGINHAVPRKDPQHKSMAIANIKQRFATSDLGRIELIDKSEYGQQGTLVRITATPLGINF
jgi:Histidine kinase